MAAKPKPHRMKTTGRPRGSGSHKTSRGSGSHRTSGAADDDDTSDTADDRGDFDSDLDPEYTVNDGNGQVARSDSNTDAFPDDGSEDSEPEGVLEDLRQQRAKNLVRSKNRVVAAGKENVPPSVAKAPRKKQTAKKKVSREEVDEPLPDFVQAARDTPIITDDDRLEACPENDVDKARRLAASKRVRKCTLLAHLDWCKPGGELCEVAQVRDLDKAWVRTSMSKMKKCAWVAGVLPHFGCHQPCTMSKCR